MIEHEKTPRHRFLYLDGLRGIAALVVVMCHFAMWFYPTTFTGWKDTARSPIELDLYRLPINIFWNGNFAVCTFFVLSGFVLSYKFLKTRDNEILYSSAFRRFPRLFIPVAGSIFIGFICVHMGWIYTSQNVELTHMPIFLQNYWAQTGDFFQAIYQSMWGVFTRHLPDYEHFNPPLWTMYFEFVGSFLVFGVLALFRNDRIRYLAYVFLAVVLWDSYVLAFVIGMVLCEMYTSPDREKFFRRGVIGLIALVIAFILGTYPFPSNDITYWAVIKLNYNSVELIHVIAAGLLVYSAISLRFFQRVLSLRPFLFLGRISFSMYLIHMFVIVVFSRRLFYAINDHGWLSYPVNFFVTMLISLAVIFPLSWLYMKLVDEKGIELSKKWYEALQAKSSTSEV